MQQCINILLFIILNEAQRVSGDTPPPLRSKKMHKQPLVLQTWRPTTARLTTAHICKTRGCLCSFRLLMMGGVLPETCWALFKIRNNKILIHCCILLGFFTVRIVLWCLDPQTSSLLETASLMRHADLRDMFKKVSKSVCTSTVVASPDPLSPTSSTSSAVETITLSQPADGYIQIAYSSD
jgi:hypothetical protein